MSKVIYLTKSRYVSGLQCLRRLWLNVHEPLERQEPEPGTALDVGIEVGRMARLLFPGGVLVAQEPWEHAAAVARTAELMADRSVPAIFEAAFEHSGVRIRVDVLERLLRGRWGLREVKSSSDIRDDHYDDVAVQAYVLKQSGMRLSSIQVLHVNTDYVRGVRDISWPRFFHREEVKAEVLKRIGAIAGQLRQQRACLSRPRAPKVEPEAHCHAPYPCEHWEACTASKPADWIYHMPNFSAERRAELGRLKVESIAKIPQDFRLSPKQGIIRHVTRTGKPYVAEELSQRIAAFGPPAFYLDFETFSPAIPLYPGTRPYQTLPFQWSLHRVGLDGSSEHSEFLGDGTMDPRRRFAETLISTLKNSKLPIVVYSGYEERCLKELASEFSDLAKPIHKIVKRLFDLLPVVRSSVYHRDFGFSNSIKSVAPALCPDVRYDDLKGIADGGAASTAYWSMASGRADAKTCSQLRQSLLAYCQRDTWALVRLHKALRTLARGKR